MRLGTALTMGWAALSLGIGIGAATAPAIVPVAVPITCTAERTGIFNPCATLDTTQVQDRRIGAPTCTWDGKAEQWVSLPCHYSDATLDLTITQQP